MPQPNLQTLHERRLARQSNSTVKNQADAWMKSMEPFIDRMVNLSVQVPDVIAQGSKEESVLETARLELSELANATHGERKGLTAIVASLRANASPVSVSHNTSPLTAAREPLPVLGQLIRNLSKIPEMATHLALSSSSYSIGHVLPGWGPEESVGLPSTEVFFEAERQARSARQEKDAEGVRRAMTNFMRQAATGIFATAEKRFNNQENPELEASTPKAKF